MRGSPETLRHADGSSAKPQLPALDELPQRLAVEADPAAAKCLVLCWHVTDMAVDIGEDDIEVLNDPVVFVVVRDLELDRERAVRSRLVLADETVRLKPAGERGFGDRGGIGFFRRNLVG